MDFDVAYRLRYALIKAAGLLSLSAFLSLETRAESSVSNVLLRRDTMVLEDASGRADVVFCRVIEGRWAKGDDGRPPPSSST